MFAAAVWCCIRSKVVLQESSVEGTFVQVFVNKFVALAGNAVGLPKVAGLCGCLGSTKSKVVVRVYLCVLESKPHVSGWTMQS